MQYTHFEKDVREVNNQINKAYSSAILAQVEFVYLTSQQNRLIDLVGSLSRTTLASVDLPLGGLRTGGATGRPAPGINLAPNPNLNLDFVGYGIDFDAPMEWEGGPGFDQYGNEFDSGVEESKVLHQGREEDITLHEYREADQGRIEELGEGELAFGDETWEEGKGLLFDEPLEEEKEKSRSASGGYPRRADIGEPTSGGDPYVASQSAANRNLAARLTICACSFQLRGP